MHDKTPHCYGSVTVGERGQVVIPAEARSAMRLEAGDKLLVFNGPGKGILLMHANTVAEYVDEAIQRLEQFREAVGDK